jgi:hypothetical protein
MGNAGPSSISLQASCVERRRNVEAIIGIPLIVLH